MEFEAILGMVVGLGPVAGNLLMVLGSLVVIGTAVDMKIPDEKDGGFMKKVLGIPLLGALLKATARFSPLNVKE